MEQDKPSMDIEERDFNHHPWVKDEQTDTQVVESSTARDCLPLKRMQPWQIRGKPTS